MDQIDISELRANLLSYLKKAQSGQPFTVTSNGEVLATIAAPNALKKAARRALDELASDAQAEDILVSTNESWDATQ